MRTTTSDVSRNPTDIPGRLIITKNQCSASDPERGQSSANDPMAISPAGSYLPITTPVVETLLSTSFSPEGMVPSENRRLPDPITRGRPTGGTGRQGRGATASGSG